MWFPDTNTMIYNSSDILLHLFAKYFNDPIKYVFLKPTEEAVEMSRKIDKMGFDLRRYIYYQVIYTRSVYILNYYPHVLSWF